MFGWSLQIPPQLINNYYKFLFCFVDTHIRHNKSKEYPELRINAITYLYFLMFNEILSYKYYLPSQDLYPYLPIVIF